MVVKATVNTQTSYIPNKILSDFYTKNLTEKKHVHFHAKKKKRKFTSLQYLLPYKRYQPFNKNLWKPLHMKKQGKESQHITN